MSESLPSVEKDAGRNEFRARRLLRHMPGFCPVTGNLDRHDVHFLTAYVAGV